VYRDLDTLRDAALPFQADRGRGGGYALDRNYTLPPVNFTAREAALVLAVGSWAASTRIVPFSDTLNAALDKVRGALSASAQRELVAYSEPPGQPFRADAGAQSGLGAKRRTQSVLVLGPLG
jgi:predicted DNA-binding transcriptional regulator YafY